MLGLGLGARIATHLFLCWVHTSPVSCEVAVNSDSICRTAQVGVDPKIPAKSCSVHVTHVLATVCRKLLTQPHPAAREQRDAVRGCDQVGMVF